MNFIKKTLLSVALVLSLTGVAFATLVPNAPITGTLDYSACSLSPPQVTQSFLDAKDKMAKDGITVTDIGRFSYKNSINATVYFYAWGITGGPNDGYFLVATLDSDGVCIDKNVPPMVVDEAAIDGVLKVSQAS